MRRGSEWFAKGQEEKSPLSPEGGSLDSILVELWHWLKIFYFNSIVVGVG